MSNKGGLLVLGRRIEESIMIGENVVVTLLSINNNQVRLGISAPRCISVHRSEIFYKIKKQREAQE